MPSTDITYCNNKNCEIKKDCFRYKIPKMSEYVSVAHFVPHYDESGVKCDMFIKKESKQ